MINMTIADDLTRLGNKTYAKRLLSILVAVICCLLFIHLVLQFLNLNVYHQQHGQIYELSNRFDLDDEASVPTWVSQALLLLLAVLAAVCAFVQSNKHTRRFWALIAFAGLFLSIDEVAGLHEYALQVIHVIFYQDASPSGFANAWLLVLPFIVLIGSWMAWAALRYLPRRTVILFVLSSITFLFGAVGIDLITSVSEREWFLNQGLFVGAEETLEMLGTAIFIYSIAEFLETHHSVAFKATLRHLKTKEIAVKK